MIGIRNEVMRWTWARNGVDYVVDIGIGKVEGEYEGGRVEGVEYGIGYKGQTTG